MTISVARVAAGLLALALCAGCQHMFGETPKSYGLSQSELVERMIAHPEAPEENTEAIVGVESQTTRGILENYHEGQERENQEERRDRPSIIDVGR